MRAKDYADRFLNNPTNKELASIANDFIYELEKLLKTRKPKLVGGFVSIPTELDKKWRAFAKIVNEKEGKIDIRPDGFEAIIYIKLPVIYRDWKGDKKERIK